ncbi:MAG TPA: hypothetical protein VIK99_09895 [Thermaerobacter sp.]
MLIESLIRIGRPFLVRAEGAAATLGDITDVYSGQAVAFFRNVIIVEVDEDAPGRPVAAWEVQDWTTTRVEGRREVVEVKRDIAVAAPFTVPKGGNPRNPQGRYAVPAYIVYENDLTRFGDEDVVRRFLEGRLSRTLERPSVAAAELARAVAPVVARASLSSIGKNRRVMGLLLILPVRQEGPYRYSPETPVQEARVDLGPSRLRPGQRVVADLAALVPLVWSAKSEEGATHGQAQGICSICQQEGDVVSIYSKAWPWFTTTWEAPLPETLPKERLVEGAALCADCYAALTQGAQVFGWLTRALPQWLTRELFAPVDSPRGRDTAQKGRAPAPLFGTGFIVPLTDTLLADPGARDQFCLGLEWMRQGGAASGWVRHLESVAGFEFAVPEDFLTEQYRVTLVYFSGQPDRGDIHLRAMIEDVLPSVLTEVDEILWHVAEGTRAVIEAWSRGPDPEDVRRRLKSLPSLLIHAYGPGYLWQNLESVLRRRPLSYHRFIRNVALRLQELARKVGDDATLWRMRDEVRFYLVFRQFWAAYHQRVAAAFPFGEVVTIRPWQELQAMLREQPVSELEFEDVEELGFAIGDLTRQFSRQYYAATRGARDFLQHRVVTFGSNLTPDAILRYALHRFPEYALRLNIPLAERFRQLNGALIVHAQQRQKEIRTQSDRFIAGFWAGYLLHDLGRPGKEAV